MQKMGHQVKVLTYGLTETDGLIPIGDVCYKKYEYESIQVISLRHKNLYPQINFNIFYYAIEDEIRQLLNVESLDDIDLIHIIHPLRMGIVAKIFNEKNIPIILTLTDYWTVCPRVQLLKPNYSLCNGPDGGETCSEVCGYAKDEMANRLRDTESLFDLADIITVPSNLVKHIFDINGFNDEKIKVVNHGLRYEYFTSKNIKKPTDNDLVTFAYIGPILKHKGVHILIEAFRKIRLSNIRLVIHGHYFHERSYFEHIQKISDKDNRIKIFGRFNYDDLSEIYSSVDIAVFPSIWYETYCIALTEATTL
jgi:glycosyltransferase involved in cell wall biosynthesis